MVVNKGNMIIPGPAVEWHREINETPVKQQENQYQY